MHCIGFQKNIENIKSCLAGEKNICQTIVYPLYIQITNASRVHLLNLRIVSMFIYPDSTTRCRLRMYHACSYLPVLIFYEDCSPLNRGNELLEPDKRFLIRAIRYNDLRLPCFENPYVLLGL